MRALLAVGTRAFIAEGVLAEAVKSHATQDARGDDAVRIDIVARNGECEGFDLGDLGEGHDVKKD